MTDENRSDGTTDETARARPKKGGGSPSAIAGALHRTPHPGPQHWGGPRPRRTASTPFFSTGPTPPPGARRPRLDPDR